MERASAALSGAARSRLAAALSTLPSTEKVLYVDDELYCPRTASSPFLNLFTSAAALRKSHSVTSIHPLSAFPAGSPSSPAPSPSPSPSRHSTSSGPTTATPAGPCAVFLLRPQARGARAVASALSALPSSCPSLVLLTPRRSRVVERVLTRAAAAPDARPTVRVAVLPLGFLPFDDGGLLTLHWPRAFSQVVLQGNNAAILAAAAALRALQDVLAADFDVIRTAGAAGAAVVEEFLVSSRRKVYAPHQERPEKRNSPGSPPLSSSTIAPSAQSPSRSGEAGGHHSLRPGNGVPDAFLAGEHDLLTIANVLANQHLRSEAGNGSIPSSSAGPSPGASVETGLPRRGMTLLVIDRNVDLVTPLLTQWTYEGLLDEAVGGLLRGNVMDVGVDEFMSEDAATMLGADGKSQPSRRVQKRLRSDRDPIFGQLRDLNYWAAARLLGNVATSVQAYYDARPGRDTAEIGKVKDYVRGLREVKSEHRSAAVHTAIAAEISSRTFEKAEFKRRFELEREMLEGSSAGGRRVLIHDAISRVEPLSHVLRLCCLWSLTGGGVDADAFEFLRREIVAAYGLAVLPLLGSLERAGLLVKSARVANQGGMPWSPFVRFGFGGGSGDQADSDQPTASNTPGSAAKSGIGGGGGGGSGTGLSVGRGGNGAAAGGRAGSNSEGVSGGNGEGGAGSPQQSSVVGYSWQFVRAAMHLMSNFEPEKADAGGLAGPYSGYVPLTVRLTEAGISERGWRSLPRFAAHTLLLPPGHTLVERSVGGGSILPLRSEGRGLGNRPAASKGMDEVDAVVLFVGGMTRAEASAIRAAAAKAGKNVLVATTDVVGPDQFATMS